MDDWPLAKIFHQISGGKPWSVAVCHLLAGDDVTGSRYPPLGWRMGQSRATPLGVPAGVSVPDRRLGNSVGAIG